MNVLPREEQIAVLSGLVDAHSERAIERTTLVNRRTISRLAMRLGAGAQRLHDRLVRDLSCSRIEMDEIWSYVGKKQSRVKEADPEGVGEAYTFVGLDHASRLVISFHVDRRDETTTKIFMRDLRSRLVVMPAITSDDFPAYPAAVNESFGSGVD